MSSEAAIHLTKLTINDATSLNRLILDNKERLLRYFPITVSKNLTVVASKQFIASIAEDEKQKIQYLYALKSKNTVIGLVYLKELDWEAKEGEFAYCIDRNYTGKGYISKTVKELSEFAFSTLGLKTLNIIAHKDNTASINVALNTNFVWQKTLIGKYTPPNGSPMDMELYQLHKKINR